MKKMFLLPLLILLVIGFILTGCSSGSSPTATQPAQTTATQPVQSTTAQPVQSTTTQPVSTQAVGTKTLTIGIVEDLTASGGIEDMKVYDLLADMDNASGGIQIGPDRYMVKTITYTNNNGTGMSQTVDVSAINRLVFQDKVKFIIDGSPFADAVLPIMENEHVLSMTRSAVFNSGLQPKWHYNFNCGPLTAQQLSFAGWMIGTYPEVLQPDKLVFCFSENEMGHQLSQIASAPFLALGASPTIIYFPADLRDLSGVGTKVVRTNPAFCLGMAGWSVSDMANIDDAIYQAGYRGRLFVFTSNATSELKAVLMPEVLEGFINGATACEFDPPLTNLALQVKNGYIAKYGKWESPDYLECYTYFALKAALQKGESTDVDKVAAILSNGLKYDVIDGPGEMVSRPDQGNDRTVDMAAQFYVKTIHNGQPQIVATITMDQAGCLFETSLSCNPISNAIR